MAIVCIYTEDGEEWVTDLFTGDASAPANYYISWGTDGTEATKADAALGVEGDEAREAGVETQPTTQKVQYVATMTCSATPKTIQEYGLFTAITDGIMIIRKNILSVAVEENDTMEITISIEQT